ncbi:MAG: efflux RND transporter periplasmic adaptor subunit [Piscinibacter sp.]|nr:efflux RND transporter periplasmic adaptor subunit [Piscinibacter sp.]
MTDATFRSERRAHNLKTLHTVVAAVGIGAAGLLAWWVQNRDGGAKPLDSAVAPASAAQVSGGRGAGDGGPAPVEVGRAEALRIEDDAQAVGSLRAHQSVMLRPEVSGRIARFGFADGARVKRGQLLVQLDDTLQRAQLQQAQAQASIARTNLQRNRELLGQNFVSASAVDQSAAALEVAEAQVALAQAQLSRMRIESPFDGVAGIRSVDLGDYVKDGADLVSLEDRSSMWVDFRLAERYLARLKPGQGVEVQVDALPGRRYAGQVVAVDALLDANGRSLLVRARLADPQGELRSGMFARARTVFSVREQAVVVPEEALVPQGGKQYLVKVVDGPNGKVSQRLEAQIGARLPGKVEILGGLKAGEVVVTAGHARLMRGEGLPVRVVDVGRDAGTPRPPVRGASNAAV